MRRAVVSVSGILVLVLGFARLTASIDYTTRFGSSFSARDHIDETRMMAESSSHDWWLSSGGRFRQMEGAGGTIVGSLSADDSWRRRYAASNPVDTDQGLHPQNIFRLVAKHRLTNLQQQAYFKIVNVNLSDSPNRNASNGVFFLNRYLDGDDIYFTGLRVDGAAVIKKKLSGKYSTLAYTRLYGEGAYDRSSNPNFLPLDKWIGMRSVVQTNPDGSVSIAVYLDDGGPKGWTVVLEATDTGNSASGPAILSPGYTGMRSDFMDVEFKGYEVFGS